MRQPLVLLTLLSTSIFSQTGGWRMVWNDEFNATALDPNKWQFETGLLRNQEAQYYTTRPENVRLENGNLVIEARREAYNGSAYTAGSIENKNRAGWIYGRIEVRAIIPTGRGMWPAIWMLGNGPGLGWPREGEIDIMEHVGYEPGLVHGTIHCGAYNHINGNQRTSTTTVSTLATAFHLYRVEWWNNRIEFFVDSTRYYTFNKDANATLDQWPFDMQEYLKLNVAVGGSWGGTQGIDVNIFPQRMTVDYARVYQWDPTVPVLFNHQKPGLQIGNPVWVRQLRICASGTSCVDFLGRKPPIHIR